MNPETIFLYLKRCRESHEYEAFSKENFLSQLVLIKVRPNDSLSHFFCTKTDFFMSF
jgi:hypothetical protein